MSEQGGRYNRSFEGLIGAIIILVVVILGFVLFRSVFSDPPEQPVPDIDYLTQVRGLQDIDADVVYPTDLPAGWQATEVSYDPGERPRFGLNLFTDAKRFVGIRLADADVDDLLTESGVDDATQGDTLTGDAAGAVGGSWQGWDDPDGDHAYSAELGGRTVIVYGSVSAETLADLVGRLTTAPVPAPAGSGPASGSASPSPS
ncbi:DUF4245 family protein [Nocardioides rubriscoriae]|uniref:DUF4245 family protein n=1 Tax=Nocardioides rubriscoriae TaxID=642762 RepID=UPI001479286A|nr:DUF4245 family protein [Nocardioides rubriscoriae]